jgi:hypothetical protein
MPAAYASMLNATAARQDAHSASASVAAAEACNHMQVQLAACDMQSFCATIQGSVANDRGHCNLLRNAFGAGCTQSYAAVRPAYTLAIVAQPTVATAAHQKCHSCHQPHLQVALHILPCEALTMHKSKDLIGRCHISSPQLLHCCQKRIVQLSSPQDTT